jgi:hypothetical protein
MIELAQVLGVLAGGIGIADPIPYVRDTLRGPTRPHRGAWLIWGVLAVVVCLSSTRTKPRHGGGPGVLTSVIFLLSSRRGDGGLSPAEAV